MLFLVLFYELFEFCLLRVSCWVVISEELVILVVWFLFLWGLLLCYCM